MLRNNYSGLWKKKFLPEKFSAGKKFRRKKISGGGRRAGRKERQRTETERVPGWELQRNGCQLGTATERVPVVSGVAIRSQFTTPGRFLFRRQGKSDFSCKEWRR